jgi:hypothetical protein
MYVLAPCGPETTARLHRIPLPAGVAPIDVQATHDGAFALTSDGSLLRISVRPGAAGARWPLVSAAGAAAADPVPALHYCSALLGVQPPARASEHAAAAPPDREGGYYFCNEDVTVERLRLPGRVDHFAAGTRHCLIAVQAPPGGGATPTAHGGRATPTNASGMSSVSSMASGGSANALRIYALGDNAEGQTGLSSRAAAALPTPTLSPNVSKLPVRRLAAGSRLSAAALGRGGVAVWGGAGACGGADTQLLVVPASRFAAAAAAADAADVLSAGGAGAAATDVAVGDDALLVLTSGGDVFMVHVPVLDGCASGGSVEVVRVSGTGTLWGRRALQVGASGASYYILDEKGTLHSFGWVHTAWAPPAGGAVAGADDSAQPQLRRLLQVGPGAQWVWRDEPVAIATHDKWQRFAVAKTGTRVGGTGGVGDERQQRVSERKPAGGHAVRVGRVAGSQLPKSQLVVWLDRRADARG